MKRAALLLLAGALLAGCMSTPRSTEHGTAIPAGIEAQLKRGVTTIGEAKALLGTPSTETVTEHGTTLGYVHMQTTSQSPYRVDSTTHSDTLVLMFDSRGILLNVARSAGTSRLQEP